MTETSGAAGGEFATFDLPKLQFNEDGWGPTWEVPQTFRDMPYQPFCKSDRMGKISDWTGNALTDKKFPSTYSPEVPPYGHSLPPFFCNLTICCRLALSNALVSPHSRQICLAVRLGQPVRLLPRRGRDHLPPGRHGARHKARLPAWTLPWQHAEYAVSEKCPQIQRSPQMKAPWNEINASEIT